MCMHIICTVNFQTLYCKHSYRQVTETTLDVSYESGDAGGSHVRRRQETLYLGDGLLLYQFRVFQDYQSLTISVRYRGNHVAESPYTVGPVLHENCACPLRTMDQWVADFGCPETDSQILRDLEPFRGNGINVTGLYERGGELFSRNSFINYSIVEGKVCVVLTVPLLDVEFIHTLAWNTW